MVQSGGPIGLFDNLHFRKKSLRKTEVRRASRKPKVSCAEKYFSESKLVPTLIFYIPILGEGLAGVSKGRGPLAVEKSSLSRPLVPKVSLLIPTYRRPAQLGRALSSIFDHNSEFDLSRTEILIGEDGSGSQWDGEYHLIWQEFGSNCRIFIRDQNIGMAANIRSLAQDAQSTYSMILTDDDALIPGAISNLLDLIDYAEAHGAGLISLPRLNVKEEGTQVGRSATVFRSRALRPSATNALRLVPRAHILTGLALRTDALTTSRWDWALNNAYFPMAIQYYTVRQRGAVLSSKELVFHTVENETHWHRWGSDKEEQSTRLYCDMSWMLEALSADALRSAKHLYQRVFLRLIRRNLHLKRIASQSLNEPGFTHDSYLDREAKCKRPSVQLSTFEVSVALVLSKFLKRCIHTTRRLGGA